MVWASKDLEILILNIDKDIHYISKLLNRNEKNIQLKMIKLGFKLQSGYYFKSNCKNCNKYLEVKKTTPAKFCSRSCATIYQNKTSTIETKEKRRESIKSTLYSKSSYSKVGNASVCKTDIVGSNPTKNSKYTCKHCNIKLDKKFQCNTCVSKIRRYLSKLKAVEYLGGKCIECGYNKHLAALEFHHKHSKDFTIGNGSNKNWDSLKKELDKCDLLCSNCHRIKHSLYNDVIKLIQYVPPRNKDS